MKDYILSIAIIIIIGGFVGCGLGLILPGGNPSAYTGYGAGAGVIAGLGYYFATKPKG